MGATKTPGLDDLLPMLFQEFWDIVWSPVINFVRFSFARGKFNKNLNHSLTYLISKADVPESSLNLD